MENFEAWGTMFANRLREMMETADYLWNNGWAECNGGNLSIRLEPEDVDDSKFASNAAPITLARSYPTLANKRILVTGSGRRFRDLSRAPDANACLLALDGEGASYRMVWGGASRRPFRPTSELPSHLLLHDYFARNHPDRSTLVHTHPTELIALTHMPEYGDEGALNRALWGMLPEVKAVVPKGVGVAPYALPGSEQLARVTLDSFTKGHPAVLWMMHGCIAMGSDALEAFDIIDTLNKAAKILLLCRSAGVKPVGLSQAQLDELVLAFDLDA